MKSRTRVQLSLRTLRDTGPPTSITKYCQLCIMILLYLGPYLYLVLIIYHWAGLTAWPKRMHGFFESGGGGGAGGGGGGALQLQLRPGSADG